MAITPAFIWTCLIAEDDTELAKILEAPLVKAYVLQIPAKIMREDMESMGPVRLRDVDAAQMAMVQVAKDLAAKGEIMLAGAGGDDELIY